MKLANARITMGTMLQVATVDALSMLVWMQTKDGRKGINRPKPLMEILTKTEKDDTDLELFESGADFEQRRAELLGRS